MFDTNCANYRQLNSRQFAKFASRPYPSRSAGSVSIRGQRKSPAAPLPGLLLCGVACFAGWQLWNSIFGISHVSFRLHFVLGSPVTGQIICPPPAGFRLPFQSQTVDL